MLLVFGEKTNIKLSGLSVFPCFKGAGLFRSCDQEGAGDCMSTEQAGNLHNAQS
jgi:hypothetical protein